MHDEQGPGRAARAAEQLPVERPVAAPACADLRRHDDALGDHLAPERP